MPLECTPSTSLPPEEFLEITSKWNRQFMTDILGSLATRTRFNSHIKARALLLNARAIRKACCLKARAGPESVITVCKIIFGFQGSVIILSFCV